MSEKLNFGNGENDPLNGFDATPGPDSFVLSGFDAAPLRLTIPAGIYFCQIESGELTLEIGDLYFYWLKFVLVGPPAYAGFTVMRAYPLVNLVDLSLAKHDLDMIGLTTGKQLLEPFPPVGRAVYCNAIISLRNANNYPINEVTDFLPDTSSDWMDCST